MNTTLTLSQPVTTARRPARSLLLTLILAFMAAFIPTRDEPAALGYAARKYAGEID